MKLLLNEDIPHNLVIMKGPHFSNNTPTVRVIVIPKVPAKGKFHFKKISIDSPLSSTLKQVQRLLPMMEMEFLLLL